MASINLLPWREAERSRRQKEFGFMLAGGTASIPGVDELVEDRIGIATTIANPFANMSVSPKVKPQRLSNDAPALMIAVGLALRAFD